MSIFFFWKQKKKIEFRQGGKKPKVKKDCIAKVTSYPITSHIF